jgi:putative phosphoribosyl transferase
VTGVPFRDRRDAADQLARRLDALATEHPVVLALPRGGVPVAAVVARYLHAPLDVLVVRKVGVPYHRELAMGAVGEEGAQILDDHLIRLARVTPEQVARVVAEERREVDRRAHSYRDGRAPLPIAGRTVVIVDDGIATGSTARAAIQVARARGASRVVLAAPVVSAESARELATEVDELVVVAAPQDFMAVGQFYDDFSATTDEEVTSILTATEQLASAPSAGTRASIDEDVDIRLEGALLRGRLTVPAAARGTVLFAHGSGSSSRSPRNLFVAERLNEVGIGTLLFDLLTPIEERDRRNVFDIELLTARLIAVTHWLRTAHPRVGGSLGYFGASTGAAAALRAAADPAVEVDAVVSRGGRADLALDALDAVRAPTLLIVGGADDVVLDLNRAAAARLPGEHQLVVVPGATHLFEEPGALEAVARYAGTWFVHHLGLTDGRRRRAS